MLDFHTHILPCVDDGSRSLQETTAMLRAMKEQGITDVIATPHFYPNHDSVDSFLARRDAAFAAIQSQLTDTPRIHLGAEVEYYEGIGRLPQLKQLRICQSRLLLLEMPMGRWSEYTVREVADMAARGSIIPVLAHVERYLFLQSKDVAARLLEHGVLFQSNSSFVTGRRHARKALRMIQGEQIHFLGSDAHNTSDRPPNLGGAVEHIRKKLGDPFASAYVEYQQKLFIQCSK